VLFIISIFFSYAFFSNFSNPEKKKHFVPKLKFYRIEFLPNLRLHLKNNILHFHHWLLFLCLLALLSVIYPLFHEFTMFKGLLLGGIFQGLTFRDRFTFVYPKEHNMFKQTQK